MITQLLHTSQLFYRNGFKRMGKLFDGLIHILCAADIPGCADIHSTVSFSHGAHGVIINKDAVIGEKCIISAKVTLGNSFPHGGAPKLGRHVYVGIGAFLGGDFCCRLCNNRCKFCIN